MKKDTTKFVRGAEEDRGRSARRCSSPKPSTRHRRVRRGDRRALPGRSVVGAKGSSAIRGLQRLERGARASTPPALTTSHFRAPELSALHCTSVERMPRSRRPRRERRRTASRPDRSAPPTRSCRSTSSRRGRTSRVTSASMSSLSMSRCTRGGAVADVLYHDRADCAGMLEHVVLGIA